MGNVGLMEKKWNLLLEGFGFRAEHLPRVAGKELN